MGESPRSAESRPADLRHEASSPELAELYRTYGRRVHAICLARLGDSAAAEDATQEVFLRIAPQLHDPRRVLTTSFLDGIARNVCREEMRRRRSAQARGTATEMGDLLDPADVALQHAVIERIWQQLSLRDRLLMLHQFAGYSRAEIAHRLGMTVKAVDMGLMRARQRARHLIGAVLLIPVRALRRRPVSYRRRSTRRPIPRIMARAPRWPAITAGIGITATAGLLVQPRIATLRSSVETVASTLPALRGAIPANTTLTDVSVAGSALFASGHGANCAPEACAVLYRSDDGGAGWTRLPAHGFAGGHIALTGGLHPILLATGARGLQRSDDGGATFRVAVPVVGPAAALPASATVAVAAPGELLLYHLGSGAISRGSSLQSEDQPDDALAVDGRTLLLSVHRLMGASPRHLGAAILRCDEAAGCREILVAPTASVLRLTAIAGDPAHHAVAWSRSSVYAQTRSGFTEIGDTGTEVIAALAASRVAGGSLHLTAAVWDPGGGMVATLRSTGADGRGWSVIDRDPALAGIRALVLTPEGRILAAGSPAMGALRCSGDAGRTWVALCAG